MTHHLPPDLHRTHRSRHNVSMKILHTADWHLGDRLGRIDRTHDLRKAVERVAIQCKETQADVLLVAGDLFSELARPDGLRETFRHWQDVFAEFLASGGTILTLTGNHDNENFCQTLRYAMTLAAPTVGTPGERIPHGRLYLAAEPTLLTLRDRHHDFDVQFVLMPYPTSTRYLKGEGGQKYSSPEEKHALLVRAFEQTLRDFREHPNFRPRVPAVLGAHAHVRGANIGHGLFRLTEQEDVLVSHEGLAEHYEYVALGHIHRAQALGGHEHVRYSGSIERMDLGEANDAKGSVLFEIGKTGRVGEIVTLPLPSSRVYDVTLTNAAEDLPRLKAEQDDVANDLVNLHITYTAGRDNLEEILRELDTIFPRWYGRDWLETGQLGPSIASGDAERSKSFSETVREYVSQELLNHADDERTGLLERLNELLVEVEP
jgi:DNA repair protein SbcD/Mre11